MIKERRAGKYVGQRQGTNKKYKLVGIYADGSRAILPIEADSIGAANRKAKEDLGVVKVVKNTTMQEQKFDSVAITYDLNAYSSSADFKNAKNQYEEDEKKRRSKS